MPSWLEIIVNILIVIVMLGVLVSIHEAGHLSMAKLFNVYCFEYSIGFGPALFRRKRKKGETFFAIRAIPFGGFVSMYGEPGVVPEGFEEPAPERSLESVAKWKKCIILVAGVTLNFILGLTLIYIGDSAFPMYYSARQGLSDNGTVLTIDLDIDASPEIASYIEANRKAGDTYEAKEYVLDLPLYETADYTAPILDSEVYLYSYVGGVLTPSTKPFVAVYSPSTLVDPHDLGSSMILFPASETEVPANLAELGVKHLPQLVDEKGQSCAYDYSLIESGTSLGLDLMFVPASQRKAKDTYTAHRIEASGEDPLFQMEIKKGKLTGVGLNIAVIKEWNSFTESWQRWAIDVPNACTAIVKGFASLFTPGGINNLSGVVGITAALPQIKASGGARMVFYLAGMLSINLAFFNLLPFPALDGWALLVTAIEGISKKKVPAKAQSIMSLIGMVLLFGLMIFITIKDIVGLFV